MGIPPALLFARRGTGGGGLLHRLQRTPRQGDIRITCGIPVLKNRRRRGRQGLIFLGLICDPAQCDLPRFMPPVVETSFLGLASRAIVCRFKLLSPIPVPR